MVNYFKIWKSITFYDSLLPLYTEHIGDLLKDRSQLTQLRELIELDLNRFPNYDHTNLLTFIVESIIGKSLPLIYQNNSVLKWLNESELFAEINQISLEDGEEMNVHVTKFVKEYSLKSILSFGDYKGFSIEKLIQLEKFNVITSYIDELWHFSLNYYTFSKLKFDNDSEFFTYLVMVLIKNDIGDIFKEYKYQQNLLNIEVNERDQLDTTYYTSYLYNVYEIDPPHDDW